MAQVSSQAQLAAALRNQEPFIQITDDFPLTSQINILYDVTIESLMDETHTIYKAPEYNSYLFRIQNGGILRLAHTIIDGQSQYHDQASAAARSLIYVTGGALYLDEGVVLKNNISYGAGGGVLLYNGGSYTNQFHMTGNARITGCSSRTNGGGVSISLSSQDDIVSISDKAMIDHNSANHGGGVYFYPAIVGLGGTLSVSGNVQVTDNTASSTGGGIYFSGYQDGSSAPSLLSLDGTLIISGNTAVHGAAVYFYGVNDGDRMSVKGGVSITENTAVNNGGGICYRAPSGSADLVIDNSSITHNTGGTGGGIYLLSDSGGTMALLETVISDNTAQNGASGSGGGIWFQNDSIDRPVIISLNESRIIRNTATEEGGGIRLFGGLGSFSFRMSKCSVSDNSAVKNGGGLLMSSAGGITDILETTITGNTAGGSGGGFYYANSLKGTSSQIFITNDTITGNMAGREGGGLRFSSSLGAVITDITDSVVSGNIADSNSGGGIWHGGTSDKLTLHGTTSVSGNSSYEGNGGGIYFNSDVGTLILMDQVKITGNHADGRASSFGNHGGGICVVPGNVTISGQAEIADNSALLYGGGISAAEQSRIDFISGSIHDNRSLRYGGAVYNHGGSIFTMGGGSILDNQAVYGGGFYNNADGQLLINGGMVSRNSADVGGGIYNAVQSSATLSASASFGCEGANTAALYAPGIHNQGDFYTEGLRDVTNGVYISSRSAVVRIEGPLISGSKIQIDNSGYVSPNEAGTAIVIGEASPPYAELTDDDRDAFLKPPSDFEGWEIRLSDDSSQILLAPIQYTIRYGNLMGASNSNPDTYQVTDPDIILSTPGPVSGYRFIGWFDAMEGGNQVTRIVQGTMGDITLYARWEKVYLIITYDANDDNGPAACGIPLPESFQEGQEIIINDSLPVRPCYVFAGWNTRPDGSGTGYSPGEIIDSLSGDIILYAVWEISCCPGLPPCCPLLPPCYPGLPPCCPLLPSCCPGLTSCCPPAMPCR